MRKVVVGITGASGAIYAKAFLEKLDAEKHLIISENGRELLEYELDVKAADVESLARHVYANDDMNAPIASGSVDFDAMVIIPCSMSTLSKIAAGIGDNLITRAAGVCLKEHRWLILVPRETPLSTIHLQNMTRLAEAGVVILPAMPGFYGKPQTVQELADFVAGKVLDILGQKNDAYRRWAGKE